MKTTIRSLALLIGLAIGFSTCKKNKDEIKDSFTYNGQTYTTNNAVNIGFTNQSGQVVYSELLLLSADYTTANFSGKVNGISLMFDHQQVTAGTYTFKDDSDPDYDPSKHFFDAYMIIEASFPDQDQGTWIEDITSGTATISVSGSNITVTYELNFASAGKITGSYSGPVKQVKE